MYRAGIEGIVGLTRTGGTLCLNPSVPKAWPELTVTIALGAAHYVITILNPEACSGGIRSAVLDGSALTVGHSGLEFPLREGKHYLTVVLGSAAA
jgi:cyclic beta-1,2-glucan synthetase